MLIHGDYKDDDKAPEDRSQVRFAQVDCFIGILASLSKSLKIQT